MRPSARTRANRLNAKRSTGPKTKSGKARVAQNALKHGLSISVERMPIFDSEVEKYFHQLVNKGMSRAAKLEARAVAIALVEIDRVRRLRAFLYNSPATCLRFLTKRERGQRLLAAVKYFDSQYIYDKETERVIGYKEINFDHAKIFLEASREKSEPISFEQGIANISAMLSKLWRYERRALRFRDKAAKRLQMLNQIFDHELEEATA